MQLSQKRLPKILIFQRILPDYRIPVFERLSNRLSFILCYGRKNSYLKNPANFPREEIGTFYPCRNYETLVLQNVLAPIFKYKPSVVITGLALGIISNWLLLVFRPIFKYRLILWSHGYNRKKGFSPERSHSDRIRIWWMKKSDAVLLYGQEDKKLLSNYVKNEKIFVAQNTLDTSRLLAIRNRLEKEGREAVKQRLAFKRKYNLLFIGRLLEAKEPDKLLKVYQKVQKEIPDIALHYVGDGPMLEILEDKVRQRRVENVFFHGPIYDYEKTGELLFASNLMVMPGALGLSVNHAFCFDTPIVSQKDVGHGPEVEYVINGETGYLVETGDFAKMAEVMVRYLKDKNIQRNFRRNIRYMVNNVCNIEKMIDGFQEAVEYVSFL